MLDWVYYTVSHIIIVTKHKFPNYSSNRKFDIQEPKRCFDFWINDLNESEKFQRAPLANIKYRRLPNFCFLKRLIVPGVMKLSPHFVVERKKWFGQG